MRPARVRPAPLLLAPRLQLRTNVRAQGLTATSPTSRPLPARYENNAIAWGKRVLAAARSGQMSTAESLVHEMRTQGVEPNSVVFGTLIDGWCRLKRPDEALVALTQSFHNKQPQGPRMFSSVMGAYCRVGRFDDAMRMLDVMRQHNVKPNVVSFTLLLESMTSAGRLRKAEEVIMAMQRHGVERDARAQEAILRLYSLTEEQEVTEEPKPANASPSTSIPANLLRWSRKIKEAVDANNPLLALSMLDTMSSASVFPNVVIYTNVVSGLARAGHVDKVYALIDRMTKENVTPNEITLVSAIEGLRNSGRVDATAALLSRLRTEFPASKHLHRLSSFNSAAEQASPDLVALSMHIRDLVHQRRTADAEKLLAKKQAEGVKPHVVVFNTLLSGWAKSGNEAKMRDVIGRMKTAGCTPTEVTRNVIADGRLAPEAAAALMNALDDRPDRSLQEGYTELVRLFFALLQYHALLPVLPIDLTGCLSVHTSHSLQAVLHATRGRADALDALISATGIKPSVATHRLLLSACVKTKQLARALTELAYLRAAGEWPSAETVSDLVYALAKSDRVSDADALLSASRTRGVVPSAAAHASVIFGWAAKKEVAKAEGVLQEMQHNGPKPTDKAFKPIIYAYAEGDEPAKAEQTQSAMLASGLLVNVSAAKAIIESWLRQGNTARASAVLAAIEAAGYPPDAQALFAIGKAEMKAGRKEAGAAVFARMEKLGMSVPSLDAHVTY